MKSAFRWSALVAAIAAAGVIVALLSPSDAGDPTLSSCRATSRNVDQLQWCAHDVSDQAQRDLLATVKRQDFAAMQADWLIEGNAIVLAAGRVPTRRRSPNSGATSDDLAGSSRSNRWLVSARRAPAAARTHASARAATII
jgi:hypothetical protein